MQSIGVHRTGLLRKKKALGVQEKVVTARPNCVLHNRGEGRSSCSVPQGLESRHD